MSVETVGAVRIARTIRAERQKVWDAWTRPEHMKLWSCPAPGGVQNIETDLKVGGAFAIHMLVDGKPHNAFGTYREVDEPRRLVYTWDWEDEENAVGETLVTVEFNEVDGGTELVLVHEGFPVEEARKGHEEGWSACIEHFTAIVA
ncbi:MAG: SRPBCC domain-containing protein [Gemmatimonadota bacterium]|nr:SRPBCC domain-containing protein [Gemmatimonadota bacterium]MDH3424823.1 SRPBCC domain-containing protein [Gemmatimonadota bacterium]